MVKEHKLFSDIKNGSFTSAVTTTYSFDFAHFDKFILHTLLDKGISSIHVLADYGQLQESIRYTLGSESSAGIDYTIDGIKANGIFHPKLTVLCGEDAIMVLLGSGNATKGGNGINHEAFAWIYADKKNKSQLPLALEAWNYIGKYTRQLSPFARHRIEREIPDHCRLIGSVMPSHHELVKVSADLQVALLYNEEESSIWSQLTAIMPNIEVENVTIVSPYFDEDGYVLRCFARQFKSADIEVLIQRQCTLPPNRMSLGNMVNFFDFEMTHKVEESQKQQKSFSRVLHAKMYFFKTRRSNYILLGSANATMAGLGIKSAVANEEFCILMKSYKRDFMDELGISGFKPVNWNIRQMTRYTSIIKDNVTEKNDVALLYAEYINGEIHIKFNNKRSTQDLTLYTINDLREERAVGILPYDGSDSAIFKIKIDESMTHCCLKNNDGEKMSNYVLINYLERLATTSVSKNNRQFNKIMADVNNGNFKICEIAAFVAGFIKDGTKLISGNNTSTKGCTNEKKKQNKKNIDDTVYDPYYSADLLTVYSNHSVLSSMSRLFIAFKDAMRDRTKRIEEDMYNEQESDATECGYKRIDTSIHIPSDELDTTLNYIESLAKNYIKLTEQRIRQIIASRETCISIDDLAFFNFTLYIYMLLCKLNVNTYKFENEEDRNYFIENANYLFNHYIPILINDFVCVLIKANVKKSGQPHIDTMWDKVVVTAFAAIGYMQRGMSSKEYEDRHRANISLCLANIAQCMEIQPIDMLTDNIQNEYDCTISRSEYLQIKALYDDVNAIINDKNYVCFDNFGIKDLKRNKYIEFKW